MTKVIPGNGNEKKLDTVPWDIFKSEAISFLSKNIKAFQWLSKSLKIEIKFYEQMEPEQWK